MTEAKQKAALTGNQAALKSCFRVPHSPPKAVIVRLALWGLIPAGLAFWLIQRGGMRHE
jgi:hypothetical protein